LIAGHADVLAGGGPAAVAAISAGADWVLIAGFFNSTPFRLMAEPGVNSAAALRGKRIGTARPGSVTDMTARIAVERLGLNAERDVEFISMSDVRVMLAALQSGAVQAGVAYPPDTAPLEDAGYHTLYDPAREAFPFQHKAVVVRRDWVTQYPAAADRVVRGVARAIHYIRTNREETMAALADFIGVTDRRGLEESYDEVILPLIPEVPVVSREGTQWIVDFMARSNPEIATVDVDRIIDNSWVNRLADSGYIARLYGR
jgi:ABC-type nitrate/sulfonate/bicarbonate transport system substrate-binding protein